MTHLKINKTTFNVESFEGVDFEAFKKEYAGKVDFDLQTAWEQIQKLLNKESESIDEQKLEKKNVRADKKGM